MRILNARKHRYGFVLPEPTNGKNIKILSMIHYASDGFPVIYTNNVSNGKATYNLYTDDEILGEKLTKLYMEVS